MNNPSPTSEKAAPGILIAMPRLNDPNFEKTVVLMVDHTPDGALGLVMNRPTKLTVAEVLDALDISWHGSKVDPVWGGGPVMLELGWAIHPSDPLPQVEGGQELAPGLYLSTTPERLRLLADNPPKNMKFVLGAAGWGEGQLDHEIDEGVWMLAQADAKLLLHTPAEKMWYKAFEDLGIDPDILSMTFGNQNSD